MFPNQKFWNLCPVLVPWNITFKQSVAAIDIFECGRVTVAEKYNQVDQLV